jgi:phosphoglucosamine mutase
MGKLFGTDGIRGTANRYPITPDVALMAGKSIAKVLGGERDVQHKVVIGKDTRISGYMLETALTSGLVSLGMDVLLVGPLPTPGVAHLTKSMGCAAGIMLTASHNPASDNGLKIFGADGYKLSDKLETEIERLILEGVPEEGASLCQEIGKARRVDDGTGRYIEFVKGIVGNQNLEGMKVVVDAAHGAAYFLGPLILQEMGAEVISTGVSPNGLNINQDCGALYPQTAEALVIEHGADVGVTFDGDADRVIFVDHTGKQVNGDRLLCLAAIGLHEEGLLLGNTVVVTSMTNLGLMEAMKARGIKVEVTGVGDRQVIERMRELGYVFGGENSGHVIFGQHSTTGDGILAALKVLTWMKSKNVRLAELADCMREYPQRLISISVPKKPPMEEIEGMNKLIADCDSDFGDAGRNVIRYSGTENKIRVLLECSDVAKVEDFAGRFESLIREQLCS